MSSVYNQNWSDIILTLVKIKQTVLIVDNIASRLITMKYFYVKLISLISLNKAVVTVLTNEKTAAAFSASTFIAAQYCFIANE